MGALFSSEPDRAEIERRRTEAYEQYRAEEASRQLYYAELVRRQAEERRQENERRLRLQQQAALERIRQQQIEERRQHSLKKLIQTVVEINPDLIDDISGLVSTTGICYYTPAPYPEVSEVTRLFRSSGKPSMRITSIQKVNNPYLKALYNLKKAELWETEEKKLFHGTTADKIPKICEGNFNYRLAGTGTGIKFGRGVSFTPISYYATHYCDKRNTEKVMLLCIVLVGNQHVGNQFTTIPIDGYDTTTNPKGHVVVKYDDDVYYPLYKITFHMSEQNVQQPNNNIFLYD